MISSSPKSLARFAGVTVAGIPILTDVSHPASNIADTISVLPGERDIKSHLEALPTLKLNEKEYYDRCSFSKKQLRPIQSL